MFCCSIEWFILNQNRVVAIFHSMRWCIRWNIFVTHLQCRHLVLLNRFVTLDPSFIGFVSSEVVLTWSDKKSFENWTKSLPNTSEKAALTQKFVKVVSFDPWICYKLIQNSTTKFKQDLLFLALKTEKNTKIFKCIRRQSLPVHMPLKNFQFN